MSNSIRRAPPDRRSRDQRALGGLGPKHPPWQTGQRPSSVTLPITDSWCNRSDVFDGR